MEYQASSRFCIYGPKRCGSFYLSDVLNGFPKVHTAYGEHFNGLNVLCFKHPKPFTDNRLTQYENYIKKIEENTNTPSYSIKVINDDIKFPIKIYLMKNFTGCYIHRKNYLSQYISHHTAVLNNTYFQTKSEDNEIYNKTKKRIYFQIDHFMSWVNKYKDMYDWAVFNKFKIFSYPEILDTKYIKKEVFPFFKIPICSPIKSNFIKISKDKFDDVENSDSMIDIISKTEYKYMLDNINIE